VKQENIVMDKAKPFILEDGGLSLGPITIRLAKNEQEIDAAQALRYRVFYEEQGATPIKDMAARKRDYDDFDEVADHLLVFDTSKPTLETQVVGNYRIIRQKVAQAHGHFYTEDEFDISKLKAHATDMVEVGRTCVEEPYRTRPILQLLWQGLAEYMGHYKADYFFGCASFRGTDVEEHRQSLSYLHHFHMIDEALRPVAMPHNRAVFTPDPIESINERQSFAQLPPLIKGYIRAGCKIGEGISRDVQWGSLDVCIILPIGGMTDRYKDHYRRRTQEPSFFEQKP
tara:strand:- start:1611 stop:2465 length:855 start_codon:yes stop_codon:yes gene_type:complete